MVMLIKRDPNVEPFDPLAVIEELPQRCRSPGKGGAASAWLSLSQPAACSFTSTPSSCGRDQIGQYSFNRVSAVALAGRPPRCFST
jgi:hypothetical protein